ncbi:MAG: type II toxin-antitoxin system VapC family toxin [Nitrospiraceae bacterium]|nr:type II toxin-antitoxin system VapC family toxin [Nitrospira sp.]MCB9775992.1 type II toxin-antitoxin system VapC family toxin [Nitrospiraceae bacterium]
MIGLDTNVLVRYLVQDDPAQSKAATQLIEKQCSQEKPGFLNHLVLCETLWVLEGCYRQTKETLVKTIEQVLRVAQLRVEDPQVVWQALDDYRKSRADFADHLLSRVNGGHDCTTTVTFDREAGKSPGFSLLP